MSTETVWLVTGCSSGIGAALAAQIASSGDSLIATARNVASLSYLPTSPKVLKLELDVTSIPSIKAAFAAAVEKFGHISIVVNNAGYALIGDTENATYEEARKQMDTNFWGVVDVTKEAVRVFREVNEEGQGGLVVQVSSVGGCVTFPGHAFYHASKFALEGFTESIAKEVNPAWNIKFLILEPGAIKTNFGSSSMRHILPHPAYADPSSPTRRLEAFMTQGDGRQHVAEPEVVAKVVFDIITKRGETPLPLRLPLGVDAYNLILAKNRNAQKTVEAWEGVTESTMGADAKAAIEQWLKPILPSL